LSTGISFVIGLSRIFDLFPFLQLQLNRTAQAQPQVFDTFDLILSSGCFKIVFAEI